MEYAAFRGERIDDETEVVEASGELDLATAPDLQRLVEAALQAGRTRLIVDLSDVTHLDSSGLAALISAHQQAAAASGGLVLVISSPHVRRTLEVRGLDRLFKTAETRESALAEASG